MRILAPPPAGAIGIIPPLERKPKASLGAFSIVAHLKSTTVNLQVLSPPGR